MAMAEAATTAAASREEEDAKSGDDRQVRVRVLCVGMCVLDIIHICEKYPEEDSDRRCEHGRWQRGGNASNNCTVLSLLGTDVDFLGAFSDAKMFKFVIDDFGARQIGTGDCPFHSDCEPPMSSVLLSKATGSRTIVHSNPNLPSLTADNFAQVDLTRYDWIHFEARNPEDTICMMCRIDDWNKDVGRLLARRITVSLDFEKPRAEHCCLVDYADFVFLGRDFATFAGWRDKCESVREFRKMTRPGNVIVCPWSDQGVAVLDASDELTTYESCSPAAGIVDTLGAGDTFCAAVIHALVRNKSIGQAVRFGTQIAGAKVGFYGYDGIKEIGHAVYASLDK